MQLRLACWRLRFLLCAFQSPTPPSHEQENRHQTRPEESRQARRQGRRQLKVSPCRKSRVQTGRGVFQEGPHQQHGAVQDDACRVAEASRQVLRSRGEGTALEQALHQGARLEMPEREVVHRRQAQRQRKLPRPSSRRPAQDQGRAHLGRRTRREARVSPTSSCIAKSAALPTCSSATRSKKATASSFTCR
jgi:hypothetical protein